MNDLDDGAGDELDPLIVALSRTPEVTPFSGTARYRVCRCLGEGGFGVVYEVEDLELGRRLALKVLKPHGSGFADTVRRLKGEFRSVADLVHPNLVGLHELSTDGARWFFTMELVRGVSFLDHVSHGDPEHRIARLRAALRQLVTGVIALHHAGIVHRDLTPLNVLVEPDGRVVILDFGLAGRENVDHDDAAGTPAYMAPEQRAGLAVTGAADWYAVGVMVHEALTGAPSASSDTLSGAPPDLARLCRALRHPDWSARPSDTQILALIGDSTPVTRSLDDSAPFVGREHELEVLRSCSLQREAAQVRIRGQAGVGKSALLARFIEDAREHGVLVLAGRCHEREFLPFKAFDGVADALERYLGELPRHEAASLMPRDIHLVAQVFPVFDGLTAAGDVPRRHASPRDPREARARAFAAIKELLARVSDKQPLVIVIDDLQWGDIDSARLLAHLVTPPDPPAMRLVLGFRDGTGDSPTLDETLRMLDLAGGPAVEIRLDRMEPADAEQLARHALPASARAGDTARLIAQRAEGHPLFILELARGVELGAATTLLEFLWRRVAALPDRARSLLETVAVAGQPLPAALCSAAAGISTDNGDALRTLRAEQLVRTTEGGAVNVFHDRIRDAILLRMEAVTQQHRHRELARAMERLPNVDLETLARHYDGAGERTLASQYALRAGDAAVSSLAFDRAAALYRLAIDRGATDGGGALHEKLATALLNAGSNVSSGEAYLAAAALADGDRVTELARCAAEQLLVVGNVEAGRAALEQALAAVGETLPRSRRAARLEMAYHLLRIYMTRWRYRERDAARISPARLLRLDVLESAAKGLYPHDPPRSMAIRARFCRAALATGEPRRVALGLIHSVYAFCLYRASRPLVVDEKLDAADAIGIRIADASVQAQVRLRRGGTHFVFGAWARAAHFLEEAGALVSEQCVGMATDRRWALMQAGSCYARMGELAAAGRMGDELLLDAVERGDPVAEKGVCVGVLAPLSLAADDADAAAAFVARGGSDDRCATVMLRTESEASVAMYLGRPQDAISAWRRSWSRVEQVRLLAVAGFRVLAVRSLATALLAKPRHRRELREAERLARSIGGLRFPYATAASASLQAAIALHRGQPARATRLLEEAAADFGAAGMTLDAAACRYRLGRAGARDELRARGIASPERWVAMVLPVRG